MKKDIAFAPVQGVSIAIIPDDTVATVEGQPGWQVYLLNHNDHALENVIVSSNGYGNSSTGETIRTSTLRHSLLTVDAKAIIPIEPIDPALFNLTNQYWVSYYIGAQVFDKKFIFLPGSIVSDNLTHIALLDRPGVLHS